MSLYFNLFLSAKYHQAAVSLLVGSKVSQARALGELWFSALDRGEGNAEQATGARSVLHSDIPLDELRLEEMAPVARWELLLSTNREGVEKQNKACCMS